MKKTILSLLAATALLAGCDNLKNPSEKDQPQEATADTAVVYRDGQTAAGAAASAANKAGAAVSNAFTVSRDKMHDLKFEEVTEPDISVRGDDGYNLYTVGEEVLFDTDKAELRSTAAAKLNQIVASIQQRYPQSQVEVMGFADSRASAGYNKDLSERRAEAVKTYLVGTGKMDATRVGVEAIGEAMPAESNATAAGRQANRRVEIAVRTK